MKKHIMTTVCPFILFIALALFTTGGTALAAPLPASVKAPSISYKHACGAASPGFASCMAIVAQLTGSSKALSVTPSADPTGGTIPYGPAALHNAYNLPTTAAGTPTVAIVDAYNDPNAESDMNTYRSMFGIPACTSASGCFKKVSQTGGTNLPRNNSGWGLEISLDLDMVSAICQNCHILLVEAKTSSFANLGQAVQEAHTLGAIAISNSYGGSESSSEVSTCSTYYQYTNVAVTASSGDSGLGVEVPAACPYVTGVGGTTLQTNGTETAWNTSSTEGAGGGCSAYIAKPSWQSSSVTGCSRKAVADVSAVADPATGVYVYDTYGESGGIQVGGTSASSPIIASVYALAGNVAATQYPASLPWGSYTTGCLFTVSGHTYAYQTGLGTPNGTGCF